MIRAIGSWAAAGIIALSFSVPAAAQIAMCSGTNPYPSSACYRFYCNSMNADGNVDADGCSESCASNPSRWPANTVGVRVDGSTVPSGVTTSEWSTVVSQSLSAWSNVTGSNLSLQNQGSTLYRTFGQNNDSHEIFWVVNNSQAQSAFGAQWQSVVNSALGVTQAYYPYCDREFVDADLVMNGANSQFYWAANSADCDGYYCQNAKATLLHELGHFVGIGHPCADDSCNNWSVMAATSGYSEPEALLAADYKVMEVLYPGTPGGMGYGCTTGGQCNGGLSCQTLSGVSYCSKTCSSNNDCEAGFECDTGGTGYCVFTGSIVQPEGGDCSVSQQNCQAGLDCLPTGSGDNGTCYVHCTTDANCDANETCIHYTDQNGNDRGQGGFCIGAAGIGEYCDGESIACSEGVCILETNNSGFCRQACNANGSGCGPNQHCFDISGDSDNFCFPAGGALEGAVCEDAFDCAVGKVCLIDGANNASHCYQRCDQSFTCGTGQTCQALSSVSYCTPLGTTLGDGDGDGDGTPGDGDGDGDGTPGDGDGDGDGTPGDGDGDGDGPPGDECDVARGNFDCPNGEGCVNGYCEEGAHGETGMGGLCDTGADCNGGLCLNGVCTRPCEYGCPGGYTCDEEAIEGGICRPESCADDASICEDGFTCTYTSAQRNVCARGSGALCTCVQGGDGDTSDPTYALAALGVLGLVFGRRRRR